MTKLLTEVEPFFQHLSRRLHERLPGRQAQRLMAPQLSYGRHGGPPPADARRAAVLVLFYRPAGGGWSLPLTRRAQRMRDHAGQISLPGGRIEAGETAEHCALRELHEELGVPPHACRLAGSLSPLYVYASHFQVDPLVAVSEQQLDFHPSSHEVDEVIELPAAVLFEPSSRGRSTLSRGGLTFDAPHYRFGPHRIWGATSMILAELAAVLASPDLRRGRRHPEVSSTELPRHPLQRGS